MCLTLAERSLSPGSLSMSALLERYNPSMVIHLRQPSEERFACLTLLYTLKRYIICKSISLSKYTSSFKVS